MTVIDDIIRREGSTFTDRASDRGHATKFGIDLATLSAWRRKPCTAQDVADLTEDEARDIYVTDFVIGPRFNEIADASLQDLVVDFGVNSSPRTAAEALQAAVGVKVDGVIGSVTLAAVNARDARATFKRVLAARMRFEGRLITNHPDQAANAAGWANRLAEFVEA